MSSIFLFCSLFLKISGKTPKGSDNEAPRGRMAMREAKLQAGVAGRVQPGDTHHTEARTRNIYASRRTREEAFSFTLIFQFLAPLLLYVGTSFHLE